MEEKIHDKADTSKTGNTAIPTDVGHDLVEEMPVMGDHHQRASEALREVALEPQDGLEVLET